MHVKELIESPVRFSVEHRLGRHTRTHDMSLSKVMDSIMFTPAEKRRISKLEVGGKVTTQRSNIQGRTMMTVTRTA